MIRENSLNSMKALQEVKVDEILTILKLVVREVELSSKS